ncbi:Heat shock protein 90-6, mitochondrial-like protein [Drosera capensis]
MSVEKRRIRKARNKLLAIGFVPYIYLAGKRIHKGALSLFYRLKWMKIPWRPRKMEMITKARIRATEDYFMQLRTPREVTTEEYNEFYKKTFNDYLEPLASSHFITEGEVEVRSILYVAEVAAQGKDDILNSKTKNIRLYVKRVFISDDFDGELFPRYLSFVKGVVDSNDLPLNVLREILQESRIAACIHSPDDQESLQAIDLLFDAAMVTSGFTLENPSQVGAKIYELMGIALSNKIPEHGTHLKRAGAAVSDSDQNPETLEAEVVSGVGSQK